MKLKSGEVSKGHHIARRGKGVELWEESGMEKRKKGSRGGENELWGLTYLVGQENNDKQQDNKDEIVRDDKFFTIRKLFLFLS